MKKTALWYGLFGLVLGMIGFSAGAASGATAFDPALQPTGYVVPPLLSNYDLRSNAETSYQVTFDKEFWYGDIFAYRVDDTGVVSYAVVSWNAAGQIQGQNWSSGRQIVTMNGVNAVPFRWANLTTTQQTDIGTEPVLNYVRGDRSLEPTYRQRKTLIGDMIHSRSVMVDNLIYVGANDGMMHVINAGNATATAAGLNPGEEVYAYVPSMVLPKLKNLTVGGPNFTTNPYTHTYFVDGPLSYGILAANVVGTFSTLGTWVVTPATGTITRTASTANLALSSTQALEVGTEYQLTYTTTLTGGTLTPRFGGITCTTVSSSGSYSCSGVATATTPVSWTATAATAGTITGYKLIPALAQKILVGTLGAGGRGIFALNISNPVPSSLSETEVAKKVLWEKSSMSTGYANLGFTYSTPSIVTVRNGVNVKTSVVIIGNGYMNTITRSSTPSDPGAGTVPGNGGASLFVIDLADGRVIREISVGTANTTTPNGLSTPTTVDTNGDGVVDYAYAGDLNGDMWKFNLTSDAPSSWTAASLIATGRPITAAPAVAPHPSDPGYYMVDFGTGRALTTTDGADATTQYALYGVSDRYSGITSTELVSQTITNKTYTRSSGTSTPVRIATMYNPWTTAGKKGWITNLPLGERVVGDGSFVSSGRYYVMTTNPAFVPNPATDADGKVIPPGENWLMELDYKTGGSATEPFLDLNGDQLLTVDDRLKDSGGAILMDATGIPVAKWAGTGVNSQPVLVRLIKLYTALYNNHPDIVAPAPPSDRGVSGGHFDTDIIWYTSSSTMDTVGTFVCDGYPWSPNTCLGHSPSPDYPYLSLPTGWTEVCSKITASPATVTRTCGGPNDCSGGSSLPGEADTTCSHSSTNGATYTCLGDHSAEADGCIGNSPSPGPYTVPSTSTQVCTTYLTDTGVTHTCLGNYSASTCYGHNPTPITGYPVPVGSVDVCTFSQPSTGFINQCAKNNSTCSGKAAYPGTTFQFTYPLPTNTYEVCNPRYGSPQRTRCEKFTNLTSCSIKRNDTSCQIKNWTTTCTRPDVGTSCLVKMPHKNFNFTHIHEYDDIYDVTGVNLRYPSDDNLRITRVVTSTSTNFKLLLGNQKLNPAVDVMFSPVGVTGAWVDAFDYDTTATMDMASKTSFNTNATLQWNVDVHAFTAKKWDPDSDVRSGLFPTNPYCVWDPVPSTWGGLNNGGNCQLGGCYGPPEPVPPGTQRSGALTVQMVKTDTTNADIQLNVAGDPSYGWRLKDDKVFDKLLVEYVIWWHHPTNGYPTNTASTCASDRCCPYDYDGLLNDDWVSNPPLDLSPSDAHERTPATGSLDPAIGNFNNTTTDAILSVVTTVSDDGTVMTTVTTYVGGATMTVVRRRNADNSYTITTTDTSGNVVVVVVDDLMGSVDRSGEEAGSAGSGRISWRPLGD